MNGAATEVTSESVTTRETTTTYWVDGRNGKMPWGWRQLALWVALPLFALLALVATPWAVDHIEDRLSAEAASDLTNAGIDPANLDIDFSYRDGEATGVLPAGVAAADAEAVVDDAILRDFEVSAEAAPAGPAREVSPAPADEDAPAPATGPVEVDATLAGSTLVLTGTVLSEAHHNAVVEAAQSAAGRAQVDDRLQISRLDPAVPGADARIGDLAMALSALGPAESWTAQLTDRSLDIEAMVTDPDAAEQIQGLEQSLGAVPTSIRIAGTVTAEISSLQSELDALIPDIRANVVFPTGSAELSARAQATLDDVVDAMQRYPEPVVVVSGHTDDRGDRASNVALSERRAAAVTAYLTARGIDADRLSAEGIGPDEPIADNTSSDGRAENRRVELKAFENFS